MQSNLRKYSWRLIAIFLFSLAALNCSGFSYRQSGWLKDEDFLQIAADYATQIHRGDISYNSGSDLRARNPQCCRVLRSGHEWTSGFSRVVGWYIIVVTVTYLYKEQGKYRYYQEEIAIDQDGLVRDSRGIDRERPGPI